MAAELRRIFAPSISPYVETLMREGRVGIHSNSFRMKDVKSGGLTTADGPNADRFKLIIPYGGHTLVWEVLFNACYPEDPPDVIFGEEDADFLPNIDNLKALINWEADNPRALLQLVEELLEEYRLYQHDLIQQHHRLQFEYNQLLEETGIQPSNVEVHVGKKSDGRLGPVSFVIRLSVDFSKIPAYMIADNPGDDTAVLVINFSSADSSTASPQLYLSPRVEHTLGGSSGLRIPQFPNGGCLVDYVPEISELLHKKVEQIVKCHEKRKEYIAAFLSRFGRSLIEFDPESYSSISFLFEWHDFFFVFSVELPRMFPHEQPTFTFQSVYHESQNQPYSKQERHYPYSPRWSSSEMVERAQNYILDYIPGFQKGSVREGSFT